MTVNHSVLTLYWLSLEFQNLDRDCRLSTTSTRPVTAKKQNERGGFLTFEVMARGDRISSKFTLNTA